MTLQEHYDKLTSLLAEHPEAKDYQLVYSKDEEGNGYEPVYYSAGIGHYDAGEWYTENDAVEHDFALNAVIIN